MWDQMREGEVSEFNPGYLGDPGDTGGATMQDLGEPHVPLAGMLVLLLGLKFLSESDVVSLDTAEVKVSIFNILNVGLQAVAFIMLLKLGSATLLRRGVVIPGLADLAGAI